MPNEVTRPYVWRLLSPIRKERLQTLFKAEETKTVFNDEFFKGVMDRLKVLEGRELKLLAVVLTLWALMALSLLPVHVKFTLFGIESDNLKALREVLLIAYSSINVYASLMTRQEASYLKEIVRAHDELLTPFKEIESLDGRNVLLLAHGLSHHWAPNPTDKNLRPMGRSFLFNLSRDVLILSFGVMLLAGSAAIQIAVMVMIVRYPNYSTTISILVVIYAMICDFAILTGWYIRKGLYPYWDDTPGGAPNFFSWKMVKFIWVIIRIVWRARYANKNGAPSMSSAAAAGQEKQSQTIPPAPTNRAPDGALGQ